MFNDIFAMNEKNIHFLLEKFLIFCNYFVPALVAFISPNNYDFKSTLLPFLSFLVIFKGKLLIGGSSIGINLPGRIDLILRKRTSKKLKCEFDFGLQMFQTFSLFKYLWASPLRHDLFWSIWKMSPKIDNFLIFQMIASYLLIHTLYLAVKKILVNSIFN